MNEFDQFIKHKLKVRYYFRYTDDFAIVSNDYKYLGNIINSINEFLKDKLFLSLHPKKVFIQPFHRGIDFLGYIIFPHHCLIRSKTRKRIFKKLRFRVMEYKNNIVNRQSLEQSLESYLGVLSHANAYKLSQELKNNFWFWIGE